MKLYTRELQPKLIRINIKQVGSKTIHIPIEGCDIDECYEVIKNLMCNQKCTPIAVGKCCTIEFREAIGKTNGKTTSFRVYNYTPLDIEKIIIEHLT